MTARSFLCLCRRRRADGAVGQPQADARPRAQVQQYSQEVRQALRRSQERERPRESPRGMDAVLGLGEECHGAVGAPPLSEDPPLGCRELVSSRQQTAGCKPFVRRVACCLACVAAHMVLVNPGWWVVASRVVVLLRRMLHGDVRAPAPSGRGRPGQGQMPRSQRRTHGAAACAGGRSRARRPCAGNDGALPPGRRVHRRAGPGRPGRGGGGGGPLGGAGGRGRLRPPADVHAAQHGDAAAQAGHVHAAGARPPPHGRGAAVALPRLWRRVLLAEDNPDQPDGGQEDVEYLAIP